MSARVLKAGSAESIARAAEIIRSGGVVALPTESFYGLAVSVWDEKAILRLLALKRRPEKNPVLILIPSVEALRDYVASVPPVAARLMERFWPGGLTLVFKATEGISPFLTAGTGKVGVRLSSHPVPTDLAKAAGTAVTGTSANLSGQPPCRSSREVMAALGNDVDLILDGGETPGGRGSTVLDVTTDPPELVREGMIAMEELRPHLSPSS